MRSNTWTNSITQMIDRIDRCVACAGNVLRSFLDLAFSREHCMVWQHPFVSFHEYPQPMQGSWYSRMQSDSTVRLPRFKQTAPQAALLPIPVAVNTAGLSRAGTAARVDSTRNSELRRGRLR